MASDDSSDPIDIEMCGVRVPKAVVLHILGFLDRPSLRAVAGVSRSLSKMRRHPSLRSVVYTSPHDGLPVMQKVIPFPPPAVLHTTLAAVTTVNPAPHIQTTLPRDSNIIIPVLPETVPIIAQVPDVVSTESEENGSSKEVVQISQILPGYAPSYASEYIPSLVNDHSFSTFANTISFNVSRYPTLSDVSVTDSKNYKEKEKAKENKPSEESPTKEVNVVEKGEERPEESRAVCVPPSFAAPNADSPQLPHEYVPAEYFRGASNVAVASLSVAPMSVGYVKSDVLSSGRLLSSQTIVSLGTTTTASTTVSTQAQADIKSNGSELQNGHAARKGNSETNGNSI